MDNIWLKYANKTPREQNEGEQVKAPNVVRINDIKNKEYFVTSLRPKDKVTVSNCEDATIVFKSSQYFSHLVIENCSNMILQLWDSCTIKSRTVEMRNCNQCTVLFDEIDVRRLELDVVTMSKIHFADSPTVIENTHIYLSTTCREVEVARVRNIAQSSEGSGAGGLAVETLTVQAFKLIKDDAETWESDKYYHATFDRDGILSCSDLPSLARDQMIDLSPKTPRWLGSSSSSSNDNNNNQSGAPPGWFDEDEDEIREYYDTPEVLARKVKEVADTLRNAKYAVCYTGAGISTSAKLPDYRGPQGVWTLRDQGLVSPEGIEITQAMPTYCHYALTELVRRDILKFIVSSNIDGLHRRTGLPADKISEVHGNCYREVCEDCGEEYLRGFDTTETVEYYLDHITG